MRPWLLALLALVSPAQADSYAPVYMSSGVEGILTRIGSFKHKAVPGFEVLYCTIESTASVTVTCVVRSPADRLLLVQMEATEHKT